MPGTRYKSSKVSPKGWVVIPAELRKRYGIQPGTIVIFEEAEGKLILRPIPKSPVEMLTGMFKEGPSLAEELLRERRKELENEERKLGRMGS